MLRLATLKHPQHNEIKEAISTDLAVYSPGLREIINGCLQMDPSERWSGDQVCEHNTLKDLVEQLQTTGKFDIEDEYPMPPEETKGCE